MIVGIFYARFLPQEGIRIVHQQPPGCIVPEEGISTPPLFNFEAVSEFIIPNQAFCNRYISIRDQSGEYQILGFPICVKDQKYERNEFMFNFGIVTTILSERDGHDMIPYEPVVRRLATTFTEMEIQSHFLSEEGSAENQGRRSIGALLEIIREDLNNYNECMIPVDKSNTINMKLFPVHKDAPPTKSWHVPLVRVRFDEIVDDRWDLTMRKIIPEIDGISDVRRVAEKANVSLVLAKIALQHLLHYETIMLGDIMLFSNIYAVTPEISDFIANVDHQQQECRAYVFGTRSKVNGYTVCKLFTTFCQGLTLKAWMKINIEENPEVMNGLDVRKLVQFGVIKRILRRVHKFPVSAQYLSHPTLEVSSMRRDRLQKYTDGCHHFDQIMTETGLPDAEVTRKLSKLAAGDVQILYR